MAAKVLVEGRPGSGKTTVVAHLADLLAQRGVDVRGFVTHELRERGRRVGFEVETVDGKRATLAHDSFAGPPRVGRYGVDLDAFERVALPALAEPPRHGVVLIDELGKMELASEPFREAISQLFDADVSLVAAAHVFGDPFTDRLKRRRDVERIRITRETRDALPERLADQLGSGLAMTHERKT
jgi:nucleoside-triphosphatase